MNSLERYGRSYGRSRSALRITTSPSKPLLRSANAAASPPPPPPTMTTRLPVIALLLAVPKVPRLTARLTPRRENLRSIGRRFHDAPRYPRGRSEIFSIRLGPRAILGLESPPT